jgi:hypothetical protein
MHWCHGVKSHTIISQRVFVDHTALAFLRDISHPDTANAETILLRSRVDFLPEWLIQLLREVLGQRHLRMVSQCDSQLRERVGAGPRQFVTHLGEAIGMRSEDSHVAWLRFGVVERDVLFHG